MRGSSVVGMVAPLSVFQLQVVMWTLPDRGGVEFGVGGVGVALGVHDRREPVFKIREVHGFEG